VECNWLRPPRRRRLFGYRQRSKKQKHILKREGSRYKHLLKSATKACIVIAAAILLLPCTGAAYRTLDGNDIEMNCQDNNTTGKKILIVYDTKYGATRTIAYKIKDVLWGQGAQVDLSTVKRIQAVSAYDTVVVGSAIIIEKWRPDALKFLKAQESVLATKHVALIYSLRTSRAGYRSQPHTGSNPLY
jgi:hypothetical protein